MRLFLPAFALASALIAGTAPAAAQSDAVATDPATGEPSVFDGDFLIVGIGAASIPSYEGSNDRNVTVAGGIGGRIGGITLTPRAAGLAADLIADPTGQRLMFNIGPVIRYRTNRTGRIKDPVVRRLGELDGVLEAGVAGGVTLNKVLHDYDWLSVGTDVRWDISGKGAGRVIAPGISYFTPVSRGQVVGTRVGFEFVDRKFAEYNYGISPAGSAASGLPQYRGRGGFKEWNVGAVTALDLSGNFLDGGFAVGGGVQYSRLQGSAAETPITSLRGKRGQWLFGGGLGYVF